MLDSLIFPVVTRGSQRAVISDGFSLGTATHRKHLGVDLMFPRRATDVDLPPDGVAGSKGFVMPQGIDVVAVADGKVWSAGYSDTYGYNVTIDHGREGYVTFYQHLASLAVATRKAGGGGPVIRAGQKLGTVGGAPTGYRLRHLHFELWHPTRDKAIDPAPYLARAKHIGSSILYQLLPVALLVLGAIFASRFAVA